MFTTNHLSLFGCTNPNDSWYEFYHTPWVSKFILPIGMTVVSLLFFEWVVQWVLNKREEMTHNYEIVRRGRKQTVRNYDVIQELEKKHEESSTKLCGQLTQANQNARTAKKDGEEYMKNSLLYNQLWLKASHLLLENFNSICGIYTLLTCYEYKDTNFGYHTNHTIEFPVQDYLASPEKEKCLKSLFNNSKFQEHINKTYEKNIFFDEKGEVQLSPLISFIYHNFVSQERHKDILYGVINDLCKLNIDK